MSAPPEQPTFPPEDEQVWSPPKNYGFAEQLRGLGGTVAAVLAGFSLAAIVTLETGDSGPPLADWALFAFASAAVFLLMTMQMSSQALGRSAPPSVRLEWHPLARFDEEHLADVRRRQRQDKAVMTQGWRRAGICYDLGVLSFQVGVLLLLIPYFWSLERWLAVGLTGLALAIELTWSFKTWRKVLRHPIRNLVKTPVPEPTPDLSEETLGRMVEAVKRPPPRTGPAPWLPAHDDRAVDPSVNGRPIGDVPDGGSLPAGRG